MEKHDVVAINWPCWMAYYIEKEDKLYFGKQLLSKYSQRLKDILDEEWYYDSPKEHETQLKLDLE